MSLGRRSVPRILLMLVLALVVLAMVVPFSALAFLRAEYAWVDGLVNFMFTVTPGFDLDHVAAFGVLGFVVYFGWPRGKALQVAVGLVCLAAGLELVQLWSPGREASVMHAVLDVMGGLAGFGLAWVAGYAWGAGHVETAEKARN